MGGYNGSAQVNTIDYITIASTGNATDFGDLSLARAAPGTTASSTRALAGGGQPSSSTYSNVIDYVEIGTLGNALHFGGLTENTRFLAGLSDGHGGLG